MVAKNREKQARRYLQSHVDPVLKPLIKQAVRGTEAFPEDFRLWLHTRLCREYGDGSNAEPMSKNIPGALRALHTTVGLCQQAFAALDQASFKNTLGSLSVLCQVATELQQHHAEEREAEEAKKRAEERRAAEAKRMAEKKREAEAKRAAEQQDRLKMRSDEDKPVKLFLSYAVRFKKPAITTNCTAITREETTRLHLL